MSATLNTSLFAQMRGEVIFDTTLSDGAYRFLSIVVYLSGKNDHCWYTQKELARLMGLSEKNGDRAIRNYQNECKRKGYMRVEQPGYHKANKYYPLVKVPPQQQQQQRPVEVIPTNEEVIHDESPSPQGRNVTTGLDRNQKPAKSHAPNNIQHDRAYRPLNEPPTAEKYAKTAAFLAGKPVRWSARPY